MELKQLIEERRTVHLFEDRPLSVEVVQELLETSVWVPNHRLTQPWRFVLVHGEGRKRLADIARTAGEKKAESPEQAQEMGQKFYDRFMAIPMFVVVLIKENENPAIAEEDYASASCIIHNLSLLAWERGIGMVWETYKLIHNPLFREALGIADDEKVVGSLHMGYPARVPKAHPRVPAAERMTVIDHA